MKTKEYAPWNIKPGFVTYFGIPGQSHGINRRRRLIVQSVTKEYGYFSKSFLYRVVFTDETRTCYFSKSDGWSADKFVRYFE